jgi:hypothetical protein
MRTKGSQLQLQVINTTVSNSSNLTYNKRILSIYEDMKDTKYCCR